MEALRDCCAGAWAGAEGRDAGRDEERPDLSGKRIRKVGRRRIPGQIGRSEERARLTERGMMLIIVLVVLCAKEIRWRDVFVPKSEERRSMSQLQVNSRLQRRVCVACGNIFLGLL